MSGLDGLVLEFINHMYCILRILKGREINVVQEVLGHPGFCSSIAKQATSALIHNKNMTRIEKDACVLIIYLTVLRRAPTPFWEI